MTRQILRRALGAAKRLEPGRGPLYGAALLLFGLGGFIAGPALALPGAPIQVEVLDNGLQLITKEDHSRPLVALCGYVLGGSRTERAELSGLSHYYEHLIFRGGSARQKELETRQQFERLGRFYGYTNEDATCYYIVVPRENLAEGLWRYTDTLMRLDLTAEKVEKERQVVLEEYYMRVSDSPIGKAYHQLWQTAFREHAYGRTVIGREDVIRNAGLDTFRSFYEARYTPNHLVLAAVGDFETDDLVRRIREEFGSFSPGPPSFELGVREPAQTEFREVVSEKPTETSNLVLGFKIPAAGNRDMAGLTVMATLLGTGQSSRLYQALKQRENLVLSVDSYLEGLHDPGLLVIEMQLDPAHELRAASILWEELWRLAEEPPSAEEMEKVKHQLEVAYAFETESFDSQAERLCRYAATSHVYLEDAYLDAVRAVTPAEVSLLARRTLSPAGCTLSLVHAPGKGQGSFRELAAATARRWPAPGAEEAAAPAPERIVLPNGLSCILRADPGASTVALEMLVRGGLWAEPDSLNGVGEFAARMLLKGTTSRNATELAERLDALGADLRSESSRDYARLTLSASRENFRDAYDLMLDALLHPSFPTEEIENVRADLLQQIDSRADESFPLTYYSFFRLLYPGHPYARPVEGEKETVERISGADLREYHRRVYVPANMVVALVGGIEKETGRKLVEETLGQLPARKPIEPGRDRLIARRVPRAASREDVTPLDRNQTTFNLGSVALAASDPNYLNLAMAARVLGSRLFFKNVYEEGIAYRMWTYVPLGLAPCPFTFEMGVSPKNYAKAVDGIKAEVQRFLAEPIPAGDWERARGDMIQRFRLAQETNAQLARQYAVYEFLGLGLEFVERYPQLIGSLREKEVRRVARRYLDPDKFAVAVVGKTAP